MYPRVPNGGEGGGGESRELSLGLKVGVGGRGVQFKTILKEIILILFVIFVISSRLFYYLKSRH